MQHTFPANIAALKAVDDALKEISEATSRHQARVRKFLHRVDEAIRRSAADSSSGDIFDERFSQQERKFVAICLLRLLCRDDSHFVDDKEFRLKAYRLFDEAFCNDLYPALKISPTLQTYEKERPLRDVVRQMETDLNLLMGTLTGLESLGIFRQNYMKAIGGKIGKTILSPFFPPHLTSDIRLNALFTVIDSYLEMKSAGKSRTLEKAGEAQIILTQYEDEAREFGTIYAVEYLANLAKQMRNLLEKDLDNYDACKAPHIQVISTGKKYPLHELGRIIALGFIIENLGPGYAFELELSASSQYENLEILQSSLLLGRLEPSSQEISIPAKVLLHENIAVVTLDVKWRNFDRSINSMEFEFELPAQRADIDWQSLEFEEPYSLEAVETEEELVGRESIIQQIISRSLAKSMGSSYVHGQKRVGKTSIAKCARSRLQSNNCLVIYLESGDYVCPEAELTVRKLGEKICHKISSSDSRFVHIPIPEFKEGALSPLVDYLDSLLLLSPDLRVLFILDEFDELPIDLYKRGPVGDSFFLTLRSISGRPPFGFMLVGGEKMTFIMSCQGDALNKFKSTPVDYFDRENYWSDFQELVRRPVRDWFDVNDDAVVALYELTAGNPFYTKWICSTLFEMMLKRRDSHITRTEIDDAAREALKNIASNSFQHFWEDGIFETTGDRCEEVSIKRRKVLLALANLFRARQYIDKQDILDNELLNQYSYDQINTELQQFVRRHVLIEKDNKYDCKIHFFKDWLTNAGVTEIMTSFSDLDTILKRRKEEEAAYVRSDEITDLVSGWGTYKGQSITEDRVRAWLQQFGENSKQRLMFKILQNVNFYTSNRVREKIREAHGIVYRGLIARFEHGKRKRSDILVSYLDGPGKSGGGHYAKLYADENSIYAGNVIERNLLSKTIMERTNLAGLVFIDDFIGTGGSAKDYFTRLNDECGQVLRDSGLKCYFIALSGFQMKKGEIQDKLGELELPINVHICDPFDESARAFSEDSRIFANPAERERAKHIAYEFGSRIIKKNYLGYGDCQALVVFESNCPNNNLPILWQDCEDPPWRPLFKRL